MGSKRGIAERLITEMQNLKPKAKYFIDVFGGGGAMSFTALQMGYKVWYNDYNEKIYKFVKFCVDRVRSGERSEFGMFPREFYDFVDRETFKKAIQTDTDFGRYCMFIWSFGNKGTTYLFGKNLEEWKKNGHNFIMFRDKASQEYIEEHYKDSCNKFIGGILNKDTWIERRHEFANIILKIEAIKVAGLKHLYDHLTYDEFRALSNKVIVDDINKYCPDIPKKNYKNHKSKRLEELKQLQQLQQLQQLDNFKMTNLSYEEMDFSQYKDEETIIYCDSPYRGTTSYEF